MDQAKAQSTIMEYLLLSFFILMVILVLIFFLSWWQFSQLGMEARNIENDRILTLMDKMSASPLLVRENSVFDDSKLMAAKTFGDQACSDLEPFLGIDWFLEVRVLNRPDQPQDCLGSNYYPECTSWSLVCGPPGERNISMVLPVNVYRKAEERTDLGLMKVGVYT